MAQTTYDYGDIARLDVEFSLGTVLTDPTTITATVKKPDGTRTNYAVGVGNGFINDAGAGAGAFYLDVPLDQSGQWAFKFVGSGAVADVAAGVFWVNEDPTAVSGTTYITTEQLKETANLGDVDFANADLTRCISAASRAIDHLCNRRFWTTTVDEARYYSATHPTFVVIEDLCHFTSLETDQNYDAVFEQTWTQNVDFILTPLNASLDGWPYTRLELYVPTTKVFPAWTVRSVKLTGKFGWTAVPAEIMDATAILASKLVKREREAPFGVVMSALDSGVSARIIRNDPDLMMLLNPFVRERVGG